MRGKPRQEAGRKTVIFTLLTAVMFTALSGEPRDGVAPGTVPVIYCTDLVHPHDDPDDHFDLATLYALPEFDLRGIVLDQGGKQLQKPGRIPVTQLNHLTGRNVPAAIGLDQKLRHPADQGLEQKTEFQEGVELILRTLRTTSKPVVIIAVGSVRDVVAAFNREPDWFRRKVEKLLVFIGEASNQAFTEYNVELDPQAYVGLMRSGLPVYWVPCFDGGLWRNAGHASFWQAKHQDLLQRAPPALLQYFIYALERETSEPLAFLNAPVAPERKARLLAAARNLWGTAIFSALAGRKVTLTGAAWSARPARRGQAGDRTLASDLFGFSEVDLSINDSAVVLYGKAADSKKVMRFEVRDRAHYAEGMTQATAELLAGFPLRQR